ncbi:O-antigen polymerase [Shewanella xiamenensis]|uniref:O-antigen polymerase n=1 Tax=Shewanella xiamenensis TaxID=332186 RepID=UPI00313AA124
MSSQEYFALIFKDWRSFIICSVMVIPFYYFFFRQCICGILDPFFMVFFYSYICFVTVVFLSVNGHVETKYIVSYFSTQLAFYFGFILFGKKPRVNLVVGQEEFKIYNARIYFYVFSFLFVISQSYVFAKQGFPLLHDSRLSYLDSSTDVKLFNRLKEIVLIPFLVCVFYSIYNESRLIKKMSYMLVLFFIFSILMTGSKSAFIFFMSVFFVFAQFSLKNSDYRPMNLIISRTKLFVLLGVFVALLVSVITISEVNPFLLILYRVFSSGDAFYMSYPGEVIEMLKNSNEWFVNLFSSPLIIFGLLDEQYKTESIGFILKSFVEGGNVATGPNSRFNIVAYLYLPIAGAIFFSFILGALVSFCRVWFFSRIKYSVVSMIVYVSIVFNVSILETDYFNAQSALINNLLAFLFVFILYGVNKSITSKVSHV